MYRIGGESGWCNNLSGSPKSCCAYALLSAQVSAIETSDAPLPLTNSLLIIECGGIDLNATQVREPISIPTSMVVVQDKTSIGGRLDLVLITDVESGTGKSWNCSSCSSRRRVQIAII